MHLLAQIPGADDAIRAATQSGRGYEAVVLVIVLLTCLGLGAYLTRVTVARVSGLETFIRDSLLSALHDSTKAMSEVSASVADSNKALLELTTAIQTTRPCWWTEERQRELLAAAADRISDSLTNLVEDRLAMRERPHAVR